jgi:hypothetical protein
MSSIPEDFPINTEVLANGEHEGFPWVAARAPLYGAVNGYVRLPDNHPWLHTEEYIENSIPWGELTYNRGNWIGFDSLHSGQHWPEQTYGPFDGDTIMTEEMVIGWAEQLAHEARNVVFNGTHEI